VRFRRSIVPVVAGVHHGILPAQIEVKHYVSSPGLSSLFPGRRRGIPARRFAAVSWPV